MSALVPGIPKILLYNSHLKMDKDISLGISLVQYNIVWENKQANIQYLEEVVAELSGKTDIVIFPEMFSTGFSMNSHQLAESIMGPTISKIKELANEYNLAICGSYIASDEGLYYNRGFFIAPLQEYYYDKHHLFRLGNEPQSFSSGNKRIVFKYKGFNICLLICYDLRFPVWARNIENEYDLLVYVANWPASRAKAWNTLLVARALENQCFVCGVNRIGKDGNHLVYQGDSQLIDAKGNKIINAEQKQNEVSTVYISKKELDDFRTKFPVWMDADRFELK